MVSVWPDCRHNKEHTIRLVDKGRRVIYCLHCIAEACGVKDKNASKEAAKDDLEKTLKSGSKATLEKKAEKTVKERIERIEKEVAEATKKVAVPEIIVKDKNKKE